MASTYTVVSGDTLWSIAAKTGLTLAQIYQYNPEFSASNNTIYAGGHINLGPSSGGSSSSSSTPSNGQANAPAPSNATIPAATSPPTDDQALLNALQGVPGTERDAYTALTDLFNSYGLSSLAPKILDYLQQGFSSDTITVLLQQSPEYEARFAGNTARTAAGLQVLTPAEYLATEASYRQALQASGLDPAFQSQTNYAEWIGQDISPAEIQQRVNLAVQATTQAPPSLTQAFTQLGFHVGDLASYFLNEKHPPANLQMKMNQAQVMAAGLANGLQVNAQNSLRYAQQGVTYAQAQTGYQHIADLLPAANLLSAVYKQQAPYTQSTAEEEFLGQSGAAQLTRENLGRQEMAAFQGQGGVGKDSFKQQTPGAPGF